MKHKTTILHLLALLFLTSVGCKSDHDGDLSPSMADRDWYRLEDSSDPTDHLRYELYKQYDVPIFYNDTIGIDHRGNSKIGEPVIHYEILDFYYWITTTSSLKIDYALNKLYQDRGDMSEVQAGIIFMRDYVLPELKPSLRPMSFLLIDKMTRNHSDKRVQHEFTTYRAMTTFIIGKLSQIGQMTDLQKKHLAGNVLGAIYAQHICSQQEEFNKFTEFFAATPLNSSGGSLYGAGIGRNSNTSASQTQYLLPANAWLDYGFLKFNELNTLYLLGSNSSTTLTQEGINSKLTGFTAPDFEQDLREYITEVLTEDDDGFTTRYADKEHVLNKFQIIKRLLPQYLASIE